MHTLIRTRSIRRVFAFALLIGLATAALFVAHRRNISRNDASGAQRKSTPVLNAKQAYGALPLSFEANQGQVDSQVKYLARGSGYSLFLTPSEAVFSLNANSAPLPNNLDDNEPGQERKISANEPASSQSSVLRMRLVGANQEPVINGSEELPGKSNYFRGNDPQKWVKGIANYEKVHYQNIYPGIDLTYYGNQRQLEYDFVIRPGSDPKQIAFSVEGADKIKIDNSGHLLLTLKGREVRQHQPLTYQEVNGARREIDSFYVLTSNNRIQFDIGEYDRTKPLVIDPVLVYSTYFGGLGNESATSIAVNGAGEAFITGTAPSVGFPGSPVQGATAAGGDAYVLKLNSAGTAVVYASYFGGDNSDNPTAIAVDQIGNAYVGGSTQSFNFPMAGAPYQSAKRGGLQMTMTTDGGATFSVPGLAGLSTANISGVAISSSDPNTAIISSFGGQGIYKTTNGGASWVSIRGTIPDTFNNAVAIDPTDPQKIYLAACQPGGIYRSSDGGNTWSATSVLGVCMNTVITDSTGAIYAGGFDGQGLHKSTDGGQTWSTYPVGSNFPSVAALAVDPTNLNTIYAGTDQGVFKSLDAGQTWTVTGIASGASFDDSLAIDPNNSQFVYSVTDSQLKMSSDGGTTWSVVSNLGITPGGVPTALMIVPTNPSTLYVGSTTNGVFKSTDHGATWSAGSSADADVSSMAFAPSNTSIIYLGLLSGSDAFVTKLNPNGSALVYSTYLGGGAASDRGDKDDSALSIAVDLSGNAFVAGFTDTRDFPTQNGLQPFGGQIDAFLARLDSNGSSLTFSTTFGGGAFDIARGVALGSGGSVFIAGRTDGGIPTVNAFQGAAGGGQDAFLMRLNPAGNSYSIAYSTYLGGANTDLANSVAVDANNNAYIVGQTNTFNLGTAGAAQTAKGTAVDGYLAKFDASGSRSYFTYFGGAGGSGQAAQDVATSVAVDGTGSAYVAGYTRSSAFPATNSLKTFNATMCGSLPCLDPFVVKINPTGSTRLYATLLGGDADDQAFGVAVDSSSAAYVVGTTSSTEFRAGALQPNNGGGTDAFITKLGPATDLSVTMTDSPDPVSINNNVTYTATITNGEANVTGVTLTDTLPANTTYVSASASQGTCSGTSTVTCNVGSMTAGSSVTVTIVLSPSVEGSTSNRVDVSSTETDTNPVNNFATQSTRVTVGTTYTVNSNADTNDGACTASGTGNGCTLREAITAANTNVGKDTIAFNIAGGGAQTINTTSGLPNINEAVFIDGSSQPGFAGALLIELKGSSAGQTSGLNIAGGNIRIKALAVNGFFYSGISLQGSNNVVEGCFIGTNLSGTAAVPNNTGISVDSGSNNLIGGPTVTARNVISGNNGNGISVNAGATGTRIKGNYIGPRNDGIGALTQANWAPGIGLYSASGSIIGGAEAGARNVISGNKGPGIFFSMTYPSGPGSANNTVQGNYIGTFPDGLTALINEGGAISINDGSNNNLIGGTVLSARNVMAPGMSLNSANANTIQGNYIGIKADGSARITTAGFSGIQLRGGSNNIIGGTVPGAGNVISGNNGPGIWIVNTCTECNPPQPNVLSTNNFVQGNIIGLNPAGTVAVPNTGNGVEISRGSTGNLIGGTTVGARNIISGNTGSGVVVNNFSGASDGNTIQGNFIGTNAAGTAAIGNGSNGIGLNGVANTTIGGTAPGAGNVISGNVGGIGITGGSAGANQPLVGATNTQVLGNFIGTNAAGTSVIRNTFHGVSINGLSSNNHVGGTAAGSRNIITGNGGNGVSFDTFNGPPTGNFVEGNYIGTDVTGMSALSTIVNGSPFYGNGSGIVISGASNNQIGGANAAQRNVISGNSCQGVNIINALINSAVVQASNNNVQGNYIGLNKDGTGLVTDPNGGAAFGNKCSGVFLAGTTNNLIGGTVPGAGNVIGGSAHQGVVVSNGNGVIGSGNTIQGNVIGSNVTMTTPLPNGIGVFLFNGSSNNVVGGDDDDDGALDGVVNAGNKIFGSGSDGIQVQSSFVSGAGGGTFISSNNKIQGNLVGGSTLLKNGSNGINLNGAMNTVVGGSTPGAGNTISFNGNNGIVVNCPTLNGAVTCGVGNTFSRNSIFSHTNNLGIRLNAGGTSTGNNNQAAPVVSFVSTSGAGTVVQGSLTTGAANQNYVLEFFSNDSCGNSSQGEGKTYIGTYNVTTDGSGTVSFTTPPLEPVPAGKIVTGTATHATNGTSRFSSCVIASPATATISGRTTDHNGIPLAGATITLSGSQNASATTDAAGNYSFPNLVSSMSYAVTASLSGVTFYPASFTLANLPADRTVNFTKAVTRYTIIDLGALTAGPQSVGWDANNAGQAIGWSNSGATATNYRPYFYNNGSITNLTPLGTGTNALAIAMNDSGRVVGYSELAPQAVNGAFSGQIHGFFSDNGGVLKDIGTFGGSSSQAWGVNDNGVVVGQAQVSTNQSRPFVWRDVNSDGICQQSEMIDLGWINNGPNGRMFAINNNNVAVGNNIDGSTGFQTATLWKDDNANNLGDPGELRLLGTLGGPTSFAQGINDTSYVSGVSDIGGFASNGRQMTRAFIWHDDNGNGVSDPGEMKSLGTLGGEFSSALRINSANEIIGWSDAVGINTAHAMRWKNNFMLDLNAVIPLNSGWSLTEARGISDDGKITGYGTINGTQHAYLLMPAPLSPQTVTFDPIANKTYGNAPFTVSASASSGLPVTFSVVSGPATVSASTVTITGAGAVTLRASQAGDATYDSAFADQTFTVAKAPLSVVADHKTRFYGAPDPAFTGAYFGFVNGDTAGSLSGSVSFTTTATQASPVGNYAITPGGLTSNNYNLNFVNGTLTITKASSATTAQNYSVPFPMVVNLVANVTANSPSTLVLTEPASVTFTIRSGATVVGTVGPVNLTNGQATGQFLTTTNGAYSVFASFAGTASIYGSAVESSLVVGSNINPVPTLSSLSPASAQAGANSFLLTAYGAGFVNTSTIQWFNPDTAATTPLSTTFISDTELRATVPASLFAASGTFEVRVVSPPLSGGGGGSSNAQTFFVTDTAAPVTAASTGVTDPSTGTASASASSPSGGTVTAAASTDGGTGSGGVTVAQYGSDPIGPMPGVDASNTFSSAGQFFDVRVSTDSSFDSLTFVYANSGGTAVYWWTGTSWQLVSNQSYNPVTNSITVTVNATTSPTIAQLTGTAFAVAGGPTVAAVSTNPAAPIAIGSNTPASVNAVFTDAGQTSGDVYSATVDWGDGQTSTGNTIAPTNTTAGSVSATHNYTAVGIYFVKVIVTRTRNGSPAFGSALTAQPVVVYDPDGPSVDGAGWFTSPRGAYEPNHALTGKLEFNFDAKYDKKSNLPKGDAKVNLKVAELDFKSTSYAWFVVTGATLRIHGFGEINKRGNYAFEITGIDGKVADGGKIDKIRIRIWDSTGAVIYDCQMSAASNASPTTALGGGSIKIQKTPPDKN